ncbi:ABC transporter substrate-binding protein [Actinomadura rugatobispora]|uniref:ABC transporter substrate-binding protein n=1 Tax=Actinomadura rugatobispora TaxID=1994 RepID=A0ABW1A3V5_9ACTN|nr:ABC transporter substrate-binding protein [Actinomadura rugatobispora]
MKILEPDPAGRSRAAVVALLTVAALGACTMGDEPDLDGTGPIVFADGRDSSRGAQIKRLVAQWNQAHPREHVEMVELAERSDEHRAQLVTRAQDAAAVRATASGRGQDGGETETDPSCYDVVALDVTWTAEFARWNYIVPLDENAIDRRAFLSEPLGSARHGGKLWGVPLRTDVGLLYYRKDVLDAEGLAPPTTWEELRRQARTVAPRHKLQGFITQLDRYEGFTVNTLESVWDTGGTVIGADGEMHARPEVIGKGFGRLVQGVQEGWIPRDALSFNEEGARSAFQDGRALFMRNWTYAHELLNAGDSPVAGKVGVARLPTPSALGGWNLALSQCSGRRATALRFMRYLSSEASERRLFAGAGFAPARKALYEDPAVRRSHLPIIRASVEGARNRGASPYYNQISSLFQARLHDVLLRPSGLRDGLGGLTTDLYRAADGR